MNEMLVDTHTHYSHKRFDSERDQIIRELVDNRVIAVVEGAIDFTSNQKMKMLCEKHSNVFMAVGCPPNCVEEMDDKKYQEIVALVNYNKVIAIGETGLDYAGNKSEVKISMQQAWFRKFIVLAIQKRKPLVIHCREAYDDVINILKEYQLIESPGVIHCFSGNLKQARALIDMGFYIGVNGMFTKMTDHSEVHVALKNIELEKIVLETDSPYLVPEGIRGKRNTSKNLGVIVEQFAKLRDEFPNHVREVVLENTKRLYPTIFAE